MTFRVTLAVLLTLVLAAPALSGSVAPPAAVPEPGSAAAEPVAVPAVAPGLELAAAWEAIFLAEPTPEQAGGDFCCVSCDSMTVCGTPMACCVNRVPLGRKCCLVP